MVFDISYLFGQDVQAFDRCATALKGPQPRLAVKVLSRRLDLEAKGGSGAPQLQFVARWALF